MKTALVRFMLLLLLIGAGGTVWFNRGKVGQVLATPSLASACNVTVTTTADSGLGSLRQALADVCANGTITFAANLSGQTILLNSELTLNRSVTIDVSALPAPVTLSGNQATRIMLVSRVSVTIRGLRFVDGNGDGGSAIYNSNGSLVISNSAFIGNQATGIGGALVNYNGVLTISNSTFISNSTPSVGGAIYNTTNSSLTISDSTFTANRGINGGGALYNQGYIGIDNSTFTGNSTTNGDGGAIGNSSVLVVQNSTFSGNSSPNSRGVGIGGAIGSRGSQIGGLVTIKNSTITGNSDGVASIDNGVLHLSNTIIANSTVGVDCVSNNPLATNLRNLIEDNSCSPALSGDPQLGPLADNGGATQTYALLPGSPAIDAGDNSVCLPTDQRGVARPIDGNGDSQAVCDLGAYEASLPPTTITIIHDAVPNSAVDFRFTSELGTFYLDDITPQDTTKDNYSNSTSFTVTPGSYTVTAFAPSTWLLIGIVCEPTAKSQVNLPLRRVTLQVAAGDNITCTFLSQDRAIINAPVCHDLNQNRTCNTGEPGLPNWTVRIYDTNNTQLLALVTDANGNANFGRQLLPNLGYKVCVDVASGWTQTVPTPLDPVLGKPCYTRTPTPGQTLTLRFGHKPVAVGAAAQEEMTAVNEDVTVAEMTEFAPDEAGADAGYGEEEESAPPSADQATPAQTQLIFLPLISQTP